MKWSFASVGLIMLGLFGIVIIMLFNDITVSNEQDYYTLKYATEASMLEAVDVAYYRLTGEIKISQEKFVENFTRRFTETSTFGQGNYGINFYQILEYPAKVSLEIYDKTSGYNIYTYDSSVKTTQPNIINRLSAILDADLVDLDTNGYVTTEESEYFGKITDVNDDCHLVREVIVGKNRQNGQNVYRCIKDDGGAIFKDDYGNTVRLGDIIFPQNDKGGISAGIISGRLGNDHLNEQCTIDRSGKVVCNEKEQSEYGGCQLGQNGKLIGDCKGKFNYDECAVNKNNQLVCDGEILYEDCSVNKKEQLVCDGKILS